MNWLVGVSVFVLLVGNFVILPCSLCVWRIEFVVSDAILSHMIMRNIITLNETCLTRLERRICRSCGHHSYVVPSDFTL
jgi:hypothetical protein